MPIPVRSFSPNKAKDCTTPGESTSARVRTVPQGEARQATRLIGRPEPVRATSNAFARRVDDSQPSDAAVPTGVGHGPTRRGARLMTAQSRGHSSAIDSNAIRKAPAVSSREAAMEPTRIPPSSNNTINFRGPSSQSDGRAPSASTRRAQGLTRIPTFHESPSALDGPASVAMHVRSSSVPKASLTVSRRPPPISLARPGFSTYQQHFSPKKSSSVTSAPASDSGGDAVRTGSVGRGIASSDIDNLQDELLQMRLVHEKSTATLQEYERSIKTKSRAASEGVEKKLDILQSLQRDRQGSVNALALSRWLEKEQNGSHARSDRLLVLAHCQNELQEISKENSSLAEAMRIFDEWCVYTSSRRSRRAADDLPDGVYEQSLGFVLRPDPIVAPQWSEVLASVEDRLRLCASSLSDLQRSPNSSSLGVVVDMHMILTEQKLQEICVCREIQRLSLREEREWVENAVADALSDANLRHTSITTQVDVRRGIWNTGESVSNNT